MEVVGINIPVPIELVDPTDIDGIKTGVFDGPVPALEVGIAVFDGPVPVIVFELGIVFAYPFTSCGLGIVFEFALGIVVFESF